MNSALGMKVDGVTLGQSFSLRCKNNKVVEKIGGRKIGMFAFLRYLLKENKGGI